jgi:UTP:GlnB (protein PII) uridylyltransferase
MFAVHLSHSGTRLKTGGIVPSESEPIEAIIYAWLKRLPARMQPMLDYQLHNLPSRYFQSLDVQGVQLDFSLMEELKNDRVIVMASELEGRTLLRVLMARDEPRIFLRVVAALAAHQIVIERALIFTGRKDNVVIDHFVLRKCADSAQLERAVAEVRGALVSGMCPTPRLLRPIPAGMRILIESHAQDHTTLTVFACDQMDFLFRIARVFADQNLGLLFANLKTHGDQIIDSFHLVNKEGNRLTAAEETQLREAILRAFAA